MTWAEVEDEVAQALYLEAVYDPDDIGTSLSIESYRRLAQVAISRVRELRLTAVLGDN
jgi:hypothetical protein